MPYDDSKREKFARTGYKAQQRPRMPKNSQDQQQNTKLYVANVPYESTEADLADLFADVAEDPVVAIVRESSGRSRGFAFVDVHTPEAAAKAIETLNGVTVNGRVIVVRMGNSNKGSRPGRR